MTKLGQHVTRPVSLGDAARGGARYSLVAQMLVQLGSITATAILARLLSPSEFGLLAVTQSILGAASLVNLMGVSNAIITRREDTARAAGSYFWLSALIGFVGYTLILLAAEPLALAVDQPESAKYLRVMALSFPLSLATTVPLALLQKELRFRALTVQALLASFSYFTIEVVLAFLGFGVWSVATGQVAGAAVGALSVLILSRFVPRHGLRLRFIREDLRLIGGLTANQALSYWQKNIDYWTISRTMGSAQLGSYYVAYVLPSIVRLRLSNAFRQVMLPILQKQSNETHGRAMWTRATRSTLTMGIPALTGIAATADPLVHVFFGPQWEEAIRPMQILTIATIADLHIQSVGTMATSRRKVGGHTVMLAARALITTSLVIGGAMMGGSTVFVAGAVALAATLSLVIQEVSVSRQLGIGLHVLGRPVLVSAVLSAVMFATVSGFLSQVHPSTPSPWDAVLRLISAVLVGLILYISLLFIVDRATFQEIVKDSGRMLGLRTRAPRPQDPDS